MKKIAFFLSILLVLSLASASFAESYSFEDAGVTIEIPDTMAVMDQLLDTEGGDEPIDGIYMLAMADEAYPNVGFGLILSYDDAFANLNLANLSNDEMETFATDILTSIGISAAAFESVTSESTGTTYFICTSEDQSQANFLCVVNGWLLNLGITQSEGAALTEADANVCVDMLQSIVANEVAA